MQWEDWPQVARGWTGIKINIKDIQLKINLKNPFLAKR